MEVSSARGSAIAPDATARGAEHARPPRCRRDAAAMPPRCRRDAAAIAWRRATSSIDLALPALPVWRPQPELLELAGGRAGELVAELHARRALVVREVLPAVLDQV